MDQMLTYCLWPGYTYKVNLCLGSETVVMLLKQIKTGNRMTRDNFSAIMYFFILYRILKTLITMRMVPFQCGNRIYTYANRLDPGQPPSSSAAGLRSNLFATQSIIPHKKTSRIYGF